MPEVISLSDQPNLVSTSKFNYHIFGFEHFNPVQSRVYEVYDQPANVVIAAPTSCGKTACAEMFLSHELHVRGGKGMYVGPLKALSQEKLDDWGDPKHLFSKRSIAICTGDYRFTKERQKELEQSEVILMTSEMLNSKVRNYRSAQNDWLTSTGTLVTDECFPGNAKVRIDANLEVPIKQIVENDSITHLLAYDSVSNSIVRKRIVRRIRKKRNEGLVRVSHEYGELVCTEGHKIWTKNRGYVKAIDLTQEDIVKWIPLSDNLTSSKVSAVKKWGGDKIEYVYDLEVEDCHNYFCNGVLVSNCHLITVPQRGDKLEIAIMKMAEANPSCRHIFLSATMPNVGEMGEWLTKLTDRDTYVIESNYRPCPLEMHYPMYDDSHWQYDAKEREKVSTALGLVRKYPDDKFLVFAHTKKTGHMMVAALRQAGIDCDFHNGDLAKEKRLKIESKFRDDPKFRVLVATSTLAWGCYAHGSLIQMNDGTLKRVEDVKNGDQLRSFTGKGFDAAEVVKWEDRYCPKLLRVQLSSGETCDVNPEHEFYGNVDGKIGWTFAELLKVGDALATPSYENNDVVWSRVVSVEEVGGGYVRELELSQHHAYVGNGIVSHNCNFPARRVIILGVHRALSEVATYDIAQMAGRAGRPRYDPKGDVYVLLPRKDCGKHRLRLENPQPIQSQLFQIGSDDYRILAFHVISEMHQGSIKTVSDIYKWYSKTLAALQCKRLDSYIVDDMLSKFVQRSLIKLEGEEIHITALGKVASMFYYSPFDTADLRQNFSILFEHGKQDDEVWIATALAKVDSNMFGIVSNAEAEQIEIMERKLTYEIRNAFGGLKGFSRNVVKMIYCHYLLLRGQTNAVFNAPLQGLRSDGERLFEVITALDGMSAKWDKGEYFKALQKKAAYGVSWDMLSLCSVSGIGKAKAQKLWEAGIRSPQEIAQRPLLTKSILKCSDKSLEKVVASAQKVAANS